MKYIIKNPEIVVDRLNGNGKSKRISYDAPYFFHKDDSTPLKFLGIKENANDYEIKIKVPNVAEDDLKIDINNSYVTISASKPGENRQNFERTFYYPGEIDTENAETKFEKGILKLELPKLTIQP